MGTPVRQHHALADAVADADTVGDGKCKRKPECDGERYEHGECECVDIVECVDVGVGKQQLHRLIVNIAVFVTVVIAVVVNIGVVEWERIADVVGVEVGEQQLYSVGIAFTFAVGVFVFREKVARSEVMGVALIVAAILLLLLAG